jgi:hypothetical protein
MSFRMASFHRLTWHQCSYRPQQDRISYQQRAALTPLLSPDNEQGATVSQEMTTEEDPRSSSLIYDDNHPQVNYDGQREQVDDAFSDVHHWHHHDQVIV